MSKSKRSGHHFETALLVLNFDPALTKRFSAALVEAVLPHEITPVYDAEGIKSLVIGAGVIPLMLVIPRRPTKEDAELVRDMRKARELKYLPVMHTEDPEAVIILEGPALHVPFPTTATGLAVLAQRILALLPEADPGLNRGRRASLRGS